MNNEIINENDSIRMATLVDDLDLLIKTLRHENDEWRLIPSELRQNIVFARGYLMVGTWEHWSDSPFPEDGIYAYVERLMMQLTDLGIMVPYRGEGHRLHIERGQSYKLD